MSADPKVICVPVDDGERRFRDAFVTPPPPDERLPSSGSERAARFSMSPPGTPPFQKLPSCDESLEYVPGTYYVLKGAAKTRDNCDNIRLVSPFPGLPIRQETGSIPPKPPEFPSDWFVKHANNIRFRSFPPDQRAALLAAHARGEIHMWSPDDGTASDEAHPPPILPPQSFPREPLSQSLHQDFTARKNRILVPKPPNRLGQERRRRDALASQDPVDKYNAIINWDGSPGTTLALPSMEPELEQIYRDRGSHGAFDNLGGTPPCQGQTDSGHGLKSQNGFDSDFDELLSGVWLGTAAGLEDSMEYEA